MLPFCLLSLRFSVSKRCRIALPLLRLFCDRTRGCINSVTKKVKVPVPGRALNPVDPTFSLLWALNAYILQPST